MHGPVRKLVVSRRLKLFHGDCREWLRTIRLGTVDFCFTDPPYPLIKRDYGYWTEEEWFEMMDEVVPLIRRVLKPTGSAVFVLQPNWEQVGRLSSWLWRFLLQCSERWNVIQDVWWWNIAAMPGNWNSLFRPSVKACVWVGPPDCFKNQESVYWNATDGAWADASCERSLAKNFNTHYNSGHHINRASLSKKVLERGGLVTPYNMMPIPNTTQSEHGKGHGAATPKELIRRWIAFACPERGTVLDTFLGSGTVGEVALDGGRSFVGGERFDKHFKTAERVLRAKASEPNVFRELE